MKFKYFIFFIFILTIYTGCDSEDNLDPLFEEYFIKYYGGEGNQEGVDLVTLNDGGFILLGNSTSTGGDSQVLVVRTDANGNEIWSNTYGGGGDEFPTDIEIESNENLLISANLEESNTVNTDILILRISSDGNVLDSAVFGSPNITETVNSLTIVSDGDIIAVGTTTEVDRFKPNFNPSTDLSDVFSIRLTTSLDPVESFNWKRTVGYPGTDRGQKILERADGSFIVFGTSNDPNSNTQQEGFNMILFPTNELGDIGSQFEVQYYGTLGNETAAEIVETIDGGYSMIGTSEQGNSRSMYAARVRSNIDFVSAEAISVVPDILATSITSSLNGGFFQLGTSNSQTSGNILLVKTNDAGAVEWNREFGGLDNDLSGSVGQLTGGSIVFVGTVELESQKKMALIKVNRLGEFNSN